MSITVLIVMIAVSMMMIMTIQALEPLPLRVAPILKPPSSSTIFQTKSTDIKHKNIHLQGKTALLYGGSPVVHIPRVYLVFWGSQWINNDPSGEAAIIISLMQGIGGTTWLNTVTQYCSDGSIGSTSCVGKGK